MTYSYHIASSERKIADSVSHTHTHTHTHARTRTCQMLVGRWQVLYYRLPVCTSIMFPVDISRSWSRLGDSVAGDVVST